MIIRIKNTLKKRNPATGAVAARLRKLLRSLGLHDAELGVLFVGDRAMRTLNRRYRGKDRTTDVLSFSLREGAFPGVQPQVLGDIVVSVPTAARQAAQAGRPLRTEIDFLLVHGLLHLLGYDHERGPKDAAVMRRGELRLMKRLSS